MTTKPRVNITVLVDDAHQADMDGIAKRLAAKGFTLKESLDQIGVLTGSIAAASVEGLSKVAGVASVERERDDYSTQP